MKNIHDEIKSLFEIDIENFSLSLENSKATNLLENTDKK